MLPGCTLQAFSRVPDRGHCIHAINRMLDRFGLSNKLMSKLSGPMNPPPVYKSAKRPRANCHVAVGIVARPRSFHRFIRDLLHFGLSYVARYFRERLASIPRVRYLTGQADSS